MKKLGTCLRCNVTDSMHEINIANEIVYLVCEKCRNSIIRSITQQVPLYDEEFDGCDYYDSDVEEWENEEPTPRDESRNGISIKNNTELSTRVRYALLRAGYKTSSDLLGLSKKELASIRGIGKHGLQEVIEWIGY